MRLCSPCKIEASSCRFESCLPQQIILTLVVNGNHLERTHKEYQKGTHHSTYNANLNWQQYAEFLGFTSEFDMLSCLYRTMSSTGIADLIGVTPKTILNRVDKLGIKKRPQGGSHTRIS